MAPGEAKNKQMSELMKQTGAKQEVTQLRKSLTERYGKGRTNIERGLARDPALKAKSEPERRASLSRINTVMKGFPVMVEMQGQVQRQERDRVQAKEQSRGIERCRYQLHVGLAREKSLEFKNLQLPRRIWTRPAAPVDGTLSLNHLTFHITPQPLSVDFTREARASLRACFSVSATVVSL